MSGHRKTATHRLGGSGSGLLTIVRLAPAAFAGAGSALDGHYLLTFSANQKTGTSMAARQPESAQWAKYSFTSSCSTGACVAKVNDSPAPINQYAQQSAHTPGTGRSG